MLTPSLPSRDERGKRWLQTQVQQILATSTVSLATPRSEDAPASYWGTGPETETTLYLRLAGDPEPKALPFRRTMIANCGSGLYVSQYYAVLFIAGGSGRWGSCPFSTLARCVHGPAHPL